MNFKYVKFNEVELEDTKITFVCDGVDVEMFCLKKGYASLKSDDVSKIDNVIKSQDVRLETAEITKEEFAEAVSDSKTVRAIDANVANQIRKKYTIDDELSMMHKDNANPEKVDYLTYREECLNDCRAQKAEIGL